jgi:WD40 repeat protein
LDGPVRAPKTAGVGTAKVRIAFDAWKEGNVLSNQQEVSIVAAKLGPKPEAISKRLKQELIHPDRNSGIWEIRFSPDGKRLLAGDYPGGVVVIWDLATGKQMTTIETGYGLRGSAEYCLVSPDWSTLFVPREKRKYEYVEKDGKRLIRWQFDGDVRVWDLNTGQLTRTYKHQPARNIRFMVLSPDGRKFVTYDQLPGVYVGGAKSALSIWDVKSGEHEQLPEGLAINGRFSPDGRTLATAAVDQDGNTQAIKLFDTDTGKEKLSIPVKALKTRAFPQVFSTDGRLLVGGWQESWTSSKSKSSLKFWDAATGKEVGSYAGEENENFWNASFCPDGKTLAVAAYGGAKGKLLLFRDQQLVKTVLLGKKTDGRRFVTHQPAFSPNNKWVAVITQEYPENEGGQELDAQDVWQARIHLIDVATGEIRETLISPPAFAMKACFSPDGRTLATSGHGRVLLWDVGDLEGEKITRPD